MKKNRLFTILSLLLLSSCSSVLSGYNSFGTNTVLSQANFDYVKKNVTGKSEVHYILGLGGNKKQAMINEAKQDLLQNYQLKSNQSLANVTVDFKYSTVLGLVSQKITCTVNADIIEFKK